MTDELDLTQERLEAELNSVIRQVRIKAASIEKGEPGECDLCGEESKRLIGGACAPCRDKHKLG